MAESSPTGPLAGVRVLDLTTVIMGPYATRILGDLGADVIRVEDQTGDVLRQFQPARSPGMGGTVFDIMRNKRSIVIDLKKPSGRDTLLRLATTVDVFVTNVRPDAVKRLRLTYEDVAAVNPSIVYCTAQGFRSDTRYGNRAAYDDLIQAASGVADLMGRVSGEPRYVPTILADKVSGLHIVYAVLAALFHRERTGEGQAIEIPMLDVTAAFTVMEHVRATAFEPPMGPFGYSRLMSPHRHPFRTADGWAGIMPYSDQNWKDFFAFVGRSDLVEDPRFSNINDRTRHIDELYALIAEVAPTRTTAEWLEFCDERSIPAAPVVSISELWEDPFVAEAAPGLFSIAEHPTEGAYRAVAHPVRFGATPAGVHRHAPRRGQDSMDVLIEAGFTAPEIEDLIERGALPSVAPVNEA